MEKHFKLVTWEEKHLDSLCKYADNPQIASKLRDIFPSPYTRESGDWYIKDCMEKEGQDQFCRAIEVEGEAVGSIGIFKKDDVYCKSGELGYWLGEKFWRQGIMSQAVKELCKESFEKMDLVRIFAEPFADNIGSRKTLEKAGFLLEGTFRKAVFKNGEFKDSCMYGLLKEEFENSNHKE